MRLFQASPELAPLLVGDVLRIELPAHHSVRGDASSFSELEPAEYRADAVTVLEAAGEPVLAIVVEVQLAVKERKRRDWLAYTASLSRKVGCEACVLVVTPERRVAKWAERPLPFGLRSTFQPLVLGPGQMPVIQDPEQAKATPFLAVLSAVAHGHDEPEIAIQAAAAARDAIVPLSDGDVYFDLIKASLGEAARKAFEMLPATYRYQDESLQNSFDRGEAKGKAHALLTLLDARGLAVSDANRERILTCADSEQLDRMVRRALSATSADELFG